LSTFVRPRISQAQDVVAAPFDRDVDPAQLAARDLLAERRRHAARHPQEAGPHPEFTRQAAGVELEHLRQGAGGDARRGHLAGRGRDRAGEQVAGQRPAPAIEQVAAHRRHEHPLLLDTLGARGEMGVERDLKPGDAQPQADQTQK
jgi:hypothetical protein